MKKQSQARVLHPSRSLKSLARSIGRKNRSSIARHAMKDTSRGVARGGAQGARAPPPNLPVWAWFIGYILS